MMPLPSTIKNVWPLPLKQALPQRRSRSLRSFLVRAASPRIMEFKVISHETEKHEFMPVVYLIDRSLAWLRRVPNIVEYAIVEDYIAPVVAEIPDTIDATKMTRMLANIRAEMKLRANLINEQQLENVITDEKAFKMGVLVNFAPSSGSPGKAALNRVVFQIATALRSASYKRALVIPVAMHYCSSVSFLDVRRYACLRYGAPVLFEEREVAIFREDPTEFTQHYSARLRVSLTMPPPPSVAQIEMLQLTRRLLVNCAKVVQDDCFSRRQRASMNEEIMQIHFRTSNHPAMQELKRSMMAYCAMLKHWKLRDEDINAARVLPPTIKDLSMHPIQFVWLLAAALRFIFQLPGRLFLASACNIIYRFPLRKPDSKLLPLGAAAVKAVLGCFILGLLVHAVPSSLPGRLIASLLVIVLAVDAAIAHNGTADLQHLIQRWKKLQLYAMDANELTRLKETRAALARSIHNIVARYMCTDLPPPVLQNAKSAASPISALLNNDEYTLNTHHQIFINSPRSFPLTYAARMKDPETARRVVYAPKMLRDETWRHIYETLAPGNLQFRVLLADNRGDDLPLDKLLATPFFGAVLLAYILYKTRCVDGNSSELSSVGDDVAHLMKKEMRQELARVCSYTEQNGDCHILGGYSSIQKIIHAALKMATG